MLECLTWSPHFVRMCCKDVKEGSPSNSVPAGGGGGGGVQSVME